jgi:flagellin-like protein
MERTQSNSDERAVSPVIGVILMVAITVILAAVIGTFVLGLGGQVSNAAPQASLSFSSGNGIDNVTISHDGGETLVASDVTIVVRNDSASARFQPQNATEISVGERALLNTSHSGQLRWPQDVTWDETSISSNGLNMSDGKKYEVLVIDKKSQQQIASATITARS